MAKSDNRLPRIGASLDGLVLKVSLAETCCRCRRTLKPHIERAFGRFRSGRRAFSIRGGRQQRNLRDLIYISLQLKLFVGSRRTELE